MKTTDNRYNSAEYKRSRVMYVGYCTFEYFISLLATDAFLAKLLTHMGVSDVAAGLISSFVTLAFLFQTFCSSGQTLMLSRTTEVFIQLQKK